MKTLICNSPGHLEYGEINKPGITKQHALLKIKHIGICGTDLHAFEGTQPFFNYPRILGHELAAEFIAAEGDTDFKSGKSAGVIGRGIVSGSESEVRGGGVANAARNSGEGTAGGVKGAAPDRRTHSRRLVVSSGSNEGVSCRRPHEIVRARHDGRMKAEVGVPFAGAHERELTERIVVGAAHHRGEVAGPATVARADEGVISQQRVRRGAGAAAGHRPGGETAGAVLKKSADQARRRGAVRFDPQRALVEYPELQRLVVRRADVTEMQPSWATWTRCGCFNGAVIFRPRKSACVPIIELAASASMEP